ncbi:MAG: protein kinase [Planctomycetota bacterium]|jgi:serine/threonine protein kinase|nr:protein kinase [Planctomycetota bacterium]
METPPSGAILDVRSQQAPGGRLYRLDRELGRGAQGTVMLAQRMDPNDPGATYAVAMKFIDPTDMQADTGRELAGLRGKVRRAILPAPMETARWRTRLLRRPRETPVVIQGYAPGPDLAALHETKHGGTPASLTETVTVLAQVAGTLKDLHAQGRVHQDIKPENLIGTRQESGSRSAYLIDWDMCAPDGTMGGAGTPLYMAPEALAMDRITGKCDVYALGMTAVTIATGTNDRGFPQNVTEHWPQMAMLFNGKPPVRQTGHPYLDLTLARATDSDHRQRSDALDLMTDLAPMALTASPTSYSAADRTACANRLVERASDPQRRHLLLDGLAARALSSALPDDSPSQAALVALAQATKPVCDAWVAQHGDPGATLDHRQEQQPAPATPALAEPLPRRWP